MLARLEASLERRRKNRGHARKEIRRMRPGKNYDEAALLEEARRELEREESRFRDSMRTIRWWSAGCLAVTTLHGALPYELLEGLDSGAARGVTACVIVSLCGSAWRRGGRFAGCDRLPAPPGRIVCNKPICKATRLTPDRRCMKYGATRIMPTPTRE